MAGAFNKTNDFLNDRAAIPKGAKPIENRPDFVSEICNTLSLTVIGRAWVSGTTRVEALWRFGVASKKSKSQEIQGDD